MTIKFLCMKCIKFNFIIVLVLIYLKFLSLLYSNSLNECELLAGLSVEFKSIDEKRAIPTCIEAVNNDPNNIKYWLFLGRSYDKAKQFEKSSYWYKKASDQGDFVAQNNLATFYYNGNGVEKDYKERALFHLPR